MCDPFSIAAGALSITSQVMSFQAESAAAEQQNRLHQQNQLNAAQAFRDTQAAITNRQSQEQEAAATEKFDAGLNMQKTAATAKVAAGEAGVSGLSVDALFRDILSENARFQGRVDANTDWTLSQLQAEKRGQGTAYVDRVNSVQRATKPSFLAAGLRIGAAGLNAYSDYKARNPTVPTTSQTPTRPR